MHSDRTRPPQVHSSSALAPMNKFACKLHGYIVYFYFIFVLGQESDSGNIYNSLVSLPDPTRPNTIHILDSEGNVIQEHVPTGRGESDQGGKGLRGGDGSRARRGTQGDVKLNKDEVQPFVAYSPSGKAQVMEYIII